MRINSLGCCGEREREAGLENRKFPGNRYKKNKGGEKEKAQEDKRVEQIGVGTKVWAILLGTLTVEPPPPDPVPPWPVSDPV